MATVLSGQIDAIIFTGGIAYNKHIIEKLESRVGFLSKIAVFPGEDEMEALASNAKMMLSGELIPRKYPH